MAGQTFARCAQLDPPSAREVQVGALVLRIEGRSLIIDAPSGLRVAAFTGPVGGTFGDSDLARLRASRAQLVFYLGGLGDSEVVATQNLARLAALGIPTLFIAGGADRVPVIEAAFAALAAPARDYVLHASGLRTLRIGGQRFAIVPGAALGRYARTADACGFTAEDLVEVAEDSRPGGADRPWLLSWHAPAGRGVTLGFGATETGSPELAAALDVAGAVSAFPEVEAGRPPSSSAGLIVPRLHRAGTLRGDGSRLGPGLSLLTLTATGLRKAP